MGTCKLGKSKTTIINISQTLWYVYGKKKKISHWLNDINQ